MGIRHLVPLLPMVAPLAHSREHSMLERTPGLRNLQTEPLDQSEPKEVTTTSGATTDNVAEPVNTAEPETTISAPTYEPEKCDSWIRTLAAKDENDSGGLSGPEYYEFLSGIKDPPYIAEYFETYGGFDELPWVFRVVHKSLACHCEQLGLGEECCESDDAEVPLKGLKDDGEGGTASDGEEEAYKDLFCQQISFVLTKSIPSPAPTDGPSFSPTKSPSSGPTKSPSMGPSAAPVTLVTGSPTPAPVTGGPTRAPSAGPTGALVMPEPTDAPSLAPSAAVPVPMSVRTDGEDGGNSGNNRGLVAVGIIVACLVALVAVVVFAAHRRRANEQEEVRKFAGEQAPEADLEAVPTVPAVPTAVVLEQEPGEDKESSAPEATADNPPVQEPDEDDESSAPSVWSDSDAEDAMDELHDDHKDPSPTAGSALAAMGAASTVTARIGANGSSD